MKCLSCIWILNTTNSMPVLSHEVALSLGREDRVIWHRCVSFLFEQTLQVAKQGFNSRNFLYPTLLLLLNIVAIWKARDIPHMKSENLFPEPPHFYTQHVFQYKHIHLQRKFVLQSTATFVQHYSSGYNLEKFKLSFHKHYSLFPSPNNSSGAYIGVIPCVMVLI